MTLYRILGKRGRITIPYEMRQRVGFSYNDVLSFTESADGKSVVVRREKICNNCKGANFSTQCYDGRYSQANKIWARGFQIPADKLRHNFVVTAHPVLTNAFCGQMHAAWNALGLFDASHCKENSEQDYTDKVVVIRPDILKDKYKTPEDQLFLVSGGNGARPNAIGRKVYGEFLKDGEKTYYFRDEIIGVLKDEYLPEWAAEKLAETQAPEENEDSGMILQ